MIKGRKVYDPLTNTWSTGYWVVDDKGNYYPVWQKGAVMERLTKTYSDGTHGASDSLPCGENSYDYKNLLIERLGKYEDLEEHGRLVKLPCKVGDTIYAIGFNNKPIIYESVVLRILITEKEIVFNVKVDEFGINSQLKQSMFDKTVFLTKSEAEVKLKEFRGGENESSN